VLPYCDVGRPLLRRFGGSPIEDDPCEWPAAGHIQLPPLPLAPWGLWVGLCKHHLAELIAAGIMPGGL
jgi:hypothetical protein